MIAGDWSSRGHSVTFSCVSALGLTGELEDLAVPDSIGVVFAHLLEVRKDGRLYGATSFNPGCK